MRTALFALLILTACTATRITAPGPWHASVTVGGPQSNVVVVTMTPRDRGTVVRYWPTTGRVSVDTIPARQTADSAAFSQGATAFSVFVTVDTALFQVQIPAQRTP